MWHHFGSTNAMGSVVPNSIQELSQDDSIKSFELAQIGALTLFLWLINKNGTILIMSIWNGFVSHCSKID